MNLEIISNIHFVEAVSVTESLYTTNNIFVTFSTSVFQVVSPVETKLEDIYASHFDRYNAMI